MAGTQGQINQTMLALTPAQVAALPPDIQAQYLRGLTPQMQAIYAQEQRISANRNFMRNSLEETVFCPPTGGSGTTIAYTAGQTLYFDIPSVAGYAKALLITYNLSVTPAAGTNALYALNKCGAFGIFSKVEIDYNGSQVTTHPYFACKIMDQLNGFQHGAQNAVLAGNVDSTIDANIVGNTPLNIGVANTWQGKMLLRLNALGADTVPGVLPASGVGNHPQLKLTCTPSFLGMDPLLNPISPAGAGSGWAVTVTGTVNVDMVFLDGTNTISPAPLQLAWQGEPTVQYSWEAALTPFNGGSTNQIKTIQSKLKHWYAVAIIIDGNSSTQFCSLSNITGFMLSPDSAGNQSFMKWNISNNISIYDYFDRAVRRPFGQDLDEGVIPWVAGPGRGVIDASNRNGSQYLNMMQGGFPATSHVYQVGNVSQQTPKTGFNAIVPRVEMFLVSENPAGLKVA